MSDLIETAIDKLTEGAFDDIANEVRNYKLIDAFFDKLGDEYGFQTSVNRLQALIKVFGYHDFESFFEDNPGAAETLLNTFIIKNLRNVPEWREAIQQSIEGD